MPQSFAHSISDLITSRRPGFSLPRAFYVDPALYEREMQQVFMQCWLFVGHVDSVEKQGDYFLYDIAEESIIVVRGEDHQIHALMNVCRHRGSRVCVEEYGHAERFVCPLDGWSYALDGRLLGAARMGDAFDRSPYGLHRCHVRVIEGLIFVSMAYEAPPLDSVAKDVERFLKPFDLSDTRIAYHRRYLCPANWKLVQEHFLHCFHHGPTYRQFRAIHAYAEAAHIGTDKARGEYNKFVDQWRATQPAETCPADVPLSLEFHHECLRRPIRPGFQTESQDGAPVAPLLGAATKYDGGVTMIQVLTSWFIVCGDHAVLLRYTPIDARVTEMDVTWLVRGDAVEGVDFTAEKVSSLWKSVIEQDLRLCSHQFNGVSSRHYQPGPLSAAEGQIEKFILWYLAQIGSASSKCGVSGTVR